MKIKQLLLATLLILCLTNCDKSAGTGGTSTIKGKIYIRDYNAAFTILQSSHYAIEERVYIMYGDHDFYDDNIRTGYDGTYEFRNLRKGSYRVFAYSADSTFTVPGGVYAVIDTVEITADYQTVEVPLMILLK